MTVGSGKQNVINVRNFNDSCPARRSKFFFWSYPVKLTEMISKLIVSFLSKGNGFTTTKVMEHSQLNDN